VAPKWIRHRTANVNRILGALLDPETAIHIPRSTIWPPQSVVNKPRARPRGVDGRGGERVLALPQRRQQPRIRHYQEMIKPRRPTGAARECGADDLPAKIYTQWYLEGRLCTNLFHFLRTARRLPMRNTRSASYWPTEICAFVPTGCPPALRCVRGLPHGRGCRCLAKVERDLSVGWPGKSDAETSGMIRANGASFWGCLV